MVNKRTVSELELMRRSGKITAQALKRVLEAAKEGVNLLDLEKIAEDEILKNGGAPSFKTVEGYNFATCLTINDEMVHGTPRDIKLKNGDKISVDVGVIFKGWHTDAAWSVIVGGDFSEKNRFLQVGEEALWLGIAKAIAGNTVGDISNAIQTKVEGAGFDVSKTLIGHGIGKELHEKPDIPGVGEKGRGLLLEENMTLAIEVIYAKGSADVYLKDDGWTYATKDKSLAGLFEMSVIVGKEKPEILTNIHLALR